MQNNNKTIYFNIKKKAKYLKNEIITFNLIFKFFNKNN